MGVSLPSGGFTPVPAALPAGRVPADISHTWDGVLHAVDRSGEPYVYDRVLQAWTAVGAGIDAAARVGSLIYHFRGSEYLTCEFGPNRASEPVPITQTWPGLPRSFQLGVCGAASLDAKLYLFAQGRYVCVDQPDAVFALAELTGWPTAPAWADGVIDGTFSLGGDQVLVFRGGEWVTFSLSEREVLVTAPTPLTDFGPFRATGIPAEVLGPGFSGGFTFQDGPPRDGQPMTVYCGTTVLAYSGHGLDESGYLPALYPGWPDGWHPQLAHAFSGRSGALWSTTQGGQLVSLEADGFHGQPQPAGQVSAGADGSVYFTDRARTSVYTLDSPEFAGLHEPDADQRAVARPQRRRLGARQHRQRGPHHHVGFRRPGGPAGDVPGAEHQRQRRRIGMAHRRRWPARPLHRHRRIGSAPGRAGRRSGRQQPRRPRLHRLGCGGRGPGQPDDPGIHLTVPVQDRGHAPDTGVRLAGGLWRRPGLLLHLRAATTGKQDHRL